MNYLQITDIETGKKCLTFNHVLDTIITQLNARFTDMSAVSPIVNFLTTFLLDIDEATLLQQCHLFQRTYSDIIHPIS